MRKYYIQLKRLIFVVFLLSASTNSYSKSISIVDRQHPLFELEWLFIKIVVNDHTFKDFKNSADIFTTDIFAAKADAIAFDSTPDQIDDISCNDEMPNQQFLTASSSCGSVTVVQSVDTYTVNSCDGYAITYRWTATDECDNSEVVTQTFNVLPDTIAPTFDNAPDAVFDISCGDALPVQQTLTASDACGSVTVVPSVDPYTVDACAGYAITYRWTATDDCGNSDDITHSFNVLPDTTAPTFDSAPEALADISCGDALPVQQTLTASDACGNVTVVPSVDPYTVDACAGYAITYRWTATDDCGNSDDITQTFNVLPDTTAPILDPAPAPITIQCISEVPAMQSLTWTDNCDGGGIIAGVDSELVGTSYNGIITRTWSVLDSCGNEAQAVQTITISDTTLPIISCPKDISVTNDPGECFASGISIANPTATDICTDNLVFIGVRNDGLDLTDHYPAGVTSITWTATDANGNISESCTQKITVLDEEKPTIICPDDIKIYTDVSCSLPNNNINLTEPIVEDNCEISSITNNLSSFGNPLSPGILNITWTVTDTSGNMETCTQKITVVDNSAPVITTLPLPEASYENDLGQCFKTLSFEAIATHGCSVPTITYSISGNPITFPYNFNVGTTTVLVTATSDNNQSTTDTFDVVVTDNVVPVIIAPMDITVPATASGCSATVNLTVPTVTDNCGIASITRSPASSKFEVGSTYVEWTATDNNGNVSTYIQTVTVTDPASTSTVSLSSSLDTSICNGTSITFTAVATDEGSNPLYQFFVNGKSQGKASPNNVWATSTLPNGNQVISVVLTAGICKTSITSNIIEIHVKPKLPVSFTLNAPVSICEGLAGFSIGNRKNFGDSPTYVWKIDDIIVEGATSDTFNPTTLASGQKITVEVSSNLDCAIPVPVSESKIVTIYPLPSVIANANGNSANLSICEGTTLFLTGSGSNASYTWDKGVTNGRGFKPNVGSHTYTVTATDSNGCRSTDQINVSVVAAPIITLNTNNKNYQEICNTSAIADIKYTITNSQYLTVEDLPPGIGYSYSGNTLTISGTPTDMSLKSYNYTVRASNETCAEVLATGTIKVYKGIPNKPDEIAGISIICPTTTATFSVPYDPNVSNYLWTLPTGITIIGPNNLNSITVSIANSFNPITEALGTISVASENPCSISEPRTKILSKNNISILLNAGVDASICFDSSKDLKATVKEGVILDNGLIFKWNDGGAGGTFNNVNDLITTYTPLPVDVLTEISLTITATFPSGDCGDVSDQLILKVYPKPIAEVVSDKKICQGDDIVIVGTPNTRVFYKLVAPNGAETNRYIDLFETGTAVFEDVPAGEYYGLASQYLSGGGRPICLNEELGGYVFMNSAPTASAGVDRTICSSSTAAIKLSPKSGGTKADVAWSTSGDGTFSGDYYTPGPNDRFYGGATLTLTNTPTDGICSPVSDSMELIIKELVIIDTQPFAVNACAGEMVTFSVGASGDDLSYQWYFDSVDNPIIGANSKNLTLSNVSLDDVGNYYVVVSGSSPCGKRQSSKAKLTVNAVAITSSPTNQSICEGSNTTLTSTAEGLNLTYQWYHNGNPVSGGTNPDLTIYNARIVDAGSYQVKVKGNFCDEISSNQATLTVNGKPIANISYSSPAYCTTEAPQLVTLTGAYNSGGVYSSSPQLSIDSATGTITPGLSSAGNHAVTYTVVAHGGCTLVKATTIVTIHEVNAQANAGVDVTSDNCSMTTIDLNGSPLTAKDAEGLWTVISGPTSGYYFSAPTKPNSQFIGQSGASYTLRWTITNSGNCGESYDEVVITIPNCEDKISFDGTDDYASFENNYNLGTSFSIEVWIKHNPKNSTQTIFSKRNGTSTASGYDLSIVNNLASFRWNGNTIISSEQITDSKWYHLAVTYDSNTYKLYLNGKLQNEVNNSSRPISNTSQALLGAMATNALPINYFSGSLDELRIWNKPLSVDQIRLMMNQEIKDFSGVVGRITGTEIATHLLWEDLQGYYRMNQSFNNVKNGYLVADAGTINGKLINMSGKQSETAPLPYITKSANSWDNSNTWIGGTEQFIPNTGEVSWNIVQTDHNISINRPVSVLGLVVNKNKLSVNNDEFLEVTKYLKIDGIMDLVGESQLLQPEGSVVDYSGLGVLERDQQGTGNMFNYNYWGSPVSTIGSSGATFRLGEILYDAQADLKVKFIAGNDGNPGPPVNIARRWLYTYNAITNQYLNTWNRITETSEIKTGLGFLMKGANNVGSADKNYTFKGQPNNGTITNTVHVGNTILVGNPYPSAIDAKAFIMDNGPSSNNPSILEDGAISYWEHFAANNTHVLRDYVGGYATYNLIGGQEATTPPPTIDGYKIAGGTGTRKPTQFIPVGQGFFVTASTTGGEVKFKNSQRIFRKEAGGQSIFFRTTEGSSSETQQRDVSSEFEDDIQRVRLTFKTPEGAVRPLLLGFTPDNSATDGIDYGYDAYNNDDFPSDLSFSIADKKFVIQGVGSFDITKKYPLDMKLKVSGPIEISLSTLENFESPIDVYIHDTLLDTYTKINTSGFSLSMEAGKYPNRFFIAFQPDNTLKVIDQNFRDIAVKYLHSTNEIYVKMPASIEVRQVYLINIAGQTVKSWNVTNMNFGQEFKIPVKDLSEGNYILKVETNSNSYNKKITIKY